MKTRFVILFLTSFNVWQTIASLVIYKGRINGEPCHVFNDCGDSPQSFLICERKICKCANFQYYQQEDRMCVSKIGERCEVEEPTDGLPMVKCGENAECRPLRHDRFGRCQCAPDYFKNSNGKCVSERSSSSHHANSILPDHPSHRRGQSQDGLNKYGDDKNDKEVMSFPFVSANTNSKTNSVNSNLKSSHYSVLFVSFLSLLGSFRLFLPNG